MNFSDDQLIQARDIAESQGNVEMVRLIDEKLGKSRIPDQNSQSATMNNTQGFDENELYKALRVAKAQKNNDMVGAIEGKLKSLNLPLSRQSSSQRMAEQPENNNQSSISGEIIGGLETGLNLGTGLFAEGIASAKNLGKAGYEGLTTDKTMEQALFDAVDPYQVDVERLTYSPRSYEGRRNLQAIGKVVEPVVENLDAANEYISDFTYDAFGSPWLAGMSSQIIPLITDLIGVKGGGNLKKLREKGKKTALLEDVAPTKEQIEQRRNELYNEVENSGFRIDKDEFEKMLLEQMEKAERRSLSVDDPQRTKTQSILRSLFDYSTGDMTLSGLDDLRSNLKKEAYKASGSDIVTANMFMDAIDDFIDDLPNKSKDKYPKEVINNLYDARKYSQRLFKNKKIEAIRETAIYKENPYRYMQEQFQAILNNEKNRRGYTKGELEEIRKAAHGQKPVSSLAKYAPFQGVGETGWSGIALSSYLKGTLGRTAAGAMLGLSQAAKTLETSKVKQRADYLSNLMLSGKDSKDIVRFYYKNVPEGKRNADELSSLLLFSSNPLKDIKKFSRGDKLLNTAYYKAKMLKNMAQTSLLGLPEHRTKEEKERIKRIMEVNKQGFRYNLNSPDLNAEPSRSEYDFRYSY